MIVRNVEEFVAGVNSLIHRRERQVAKARTTTGRSLPDTSVDQSGPVPGREFAEASFAQIYYLPSPISQLFRRENADGSITYMEILDARISGFTNGAGSSYVPDTVSRAYGTDVFTGQTGPGWGWSTNYDNFIRS